MIAELIAEYESGHPWPISGDGVARTRANQGAGGLVGVVDWASFDSEDTEA